jgi:hypothetical protein
MEKVLKEVCEVSDIKPLSRTVILRNLHNQIYQKEQLLNAIILIMNGATSTNNSAEVLTVEIANTNDSDSDDVVLTNKSVNMIGDVNVQYTQSKSKGGSE